MKGLDLAERYWNEVGRPALAVACPEAAERWSAGLVGEGSECFGFDDEVSRDHDWGPGFCVWLDAPDFERFGARLQAAYDALPAEFMGFRRDVQPEGAGRVGVMESGAFYARFTGLPTPPRTVGEWLSLDDEVLATCVNGRVFEDGAQGFSAYRAELSRYYPRDILLKKLAAHCALAGQAGQYNYPRCEGRGDAVAALMALARFIEHAQAAVFMLNKRYRPYYKWANRALADLPVLGDLAPRFSALAQGGAFGHASQIEGICRRIADTLAERGMADASDGGFLLACAHRIQGEVHNDSIRALPLLVHTV